MIIRANNNMWSHKKYFFHIFYCFWDKTTYFGFLRKNNIFLLFSQHKPNILHFCRKKTKTKFDPFPSKKFSSSLLLIILANVCILRVVLDSAKAPPILILEGDFSWHRFPLAAGQWPKNFRNCYRFTLIG